MGLTVKQELVPHDITKQPIKYDVTEERLLELEDLYAVEKMPTDLTIKDNYTVIKDGVAVCRKLRGEIDRHRKSLGSDAREYIKKVNSAGNEIIDRIKAVESPMKSAKDAFDTAKEIAKREAAKAEEARIDEINSNIASIKALVESNISTTSDVIADVLSGLALEKPEEWADEFTDKAKVVIAETINKLKELYQMKFNAEKATEIEAKANEDRLAREEEERKEREAHNAKVAADNKAAQDLLDEQRAEMQAEKDAFEAEKKAEADRLAEVELKEKAEYDAEIATLNAEVAEQEACDDIAAFCSSDLTMGALIVAVKNGHVRHFKWVN